MAERGEGPTNAERDLWRERAAAVPDGSLEPAELPRALLEDAGAHARECYPEECCGLVFGRPEGPPERLVRCTNVQSRRFSRGESELDARHAFWIDEQEQLEALQQADVSGQALLVVYHSHVDAPAYFSHTDVRSALDDQGAPLHPDVAWLVLSVESDGIHGSAIYDWDPATESFVGRGVRALR